MNAKKEEVGVVKLVDLADALDTQMYDNAWYVDASSGEILIIDEATLRFIDDNYDLLTDPDSQEEGIKELMEAGWLGAYDVDDLRKLAEGYDRTLIYVEPLGSHEQYEIMDEFIETITNDEVRKLLYVAIEGKGAFRRFKDSLASIGMLDEYYEYHDQVLICKAQKWCEERNLPYQ